MQRVAQIHRVVRLQGTEARTHLIVWQTKPVAFARENYSVRAIPGSHDQGAAEAAADPPPGAREKRVLDHQVHDKQAMRCQAPKTIVVEVCGAQLRRFTV